MSKIDIETLIAGIDVDSLDSAKKVCASSLQLLYSQYNSFLHFSTDNIKLLGKYIEFVDIKNLTTRNFQRTISETILLLMGTLEEVSIDFLNFSISLISIFDSSIQKVDDLSTYINENIDKQKIIDFITVNLESPISQIWKGLKIAGEYAKFDDNTKFDLDIFQRAYVSFVVAGVLASESYTDKTVEYLYTSIAKTSELFYGNSQIAPFTRSDLLVF